jgi:hypothetical protein
VVVVGGSKVVVVVVSRVYIYLVQSVRLASNTWCLNGIDEMYDVNNWEACSSSKVLKFRASITSNVSGHTTTWREPRKMEAC